MLENATTDNITQEDIQKMNEFRQLKLQYDELFKRYQQTKAMQMEAEALIKELKSMRINKIYEMRGFGVIIPINRKDKIIKLQELKEELDKQVSQLESTLKSFVDKLKELEPIVEKIQQRLNKPQEEPTDDVVEQQDDESEK